MHECAKGRGATRRLGNPQKHGAHTQAEHNQARKELATDPLMEAFRRLGPISKHSGQQGSCPELDLVRCLKC